MYVGSYHSPLEALVLAFLGFCVGVSSSFFGVGGAFLVTPALNILGFPMAYAIGTDLAHMTGKSIVATLQHRKMGNVDMAAGLLLLLGTLPGVRLGATAIMALEKLHATEWVVRGVYALILTYVGLYVLRESLAWAKTKKDGRNRCLFARLRIPPMVRLRVSGIESISVWGMVLLGLATGFVAGFLGVGGGFIRMPALIYLAGMPTRVAVGTDLLEVIMSGGYGAFLYAREGRVDLIAALIMLVGASVGSQLGAQATRFVEETRIRAYLGVTMLGSAAAVVAKQLGQQVVSVGILAVLGPSLAGLIIYRLIAGRRELAAVSQGGKA